MAVEVDQQRMQLAIESGVFDPECAAAFLSFPTVEAFNERRREFKMQGVRFGRQWRYSREFLESLRRLVFGMDVPGRKKA